MTRIFLALIAAVFPAALSAQCPTGDDLATGIAFTGEHGEREVFTDLGNGMVSASYKAQDGYATEALLAHGVFLIDLLDLVGTEGENRTTYEFPIELDEMELPQENGSWDVTVSVTDGKNNVFERQLYTYAALEQHSYGACTYGVIPITTEYSTAPDVVETYHFLPALGLSYLYAYTDPRGEEVYPYTAIEALP